MLNTGRERQHALLGPLARRVVLRNGQLCESDVDLGGLYRVLSGLVAEPTHRAELILDGGQTEIVLRLRQRVLRRRELETLYSVYTELNLP